MHEQSTQTMRQQAIEDQLYILWRALPVRGVTDPEGLLSDYQFALQGCSAAAVENVVNALRAGMIEDASKEFAPKPPKLGEYGRAEQRRLDAINRPPAVTYRAVDRPWTDPKVTQRLRTQELAAKGYKLVAENLDIDTANMKARRRVLKTGTIWFWALQEAWEPTGAPEQAAYRRKIASDMPDDERREAAE